MALPSKADPDAPNRPTAADPFLEFESEHVAVRPAASALDTLFRRVPPRVPEPQPEPEPESEPEPEQEPEREFRLRPLQQLQQLQPPDEPKRRTFPVSPVFAFALGIAGLVTAAVAYYQLAQSLSSRPSGTAPAASVAAAPGAAATPGAGVPASGSARRDTNASNPTRARGDGLARGASAAPAPAAVAAARSIDNGWVVIESPIELSVFERGRLRGTTRAGRVTLPPGAHDLDLVNEALGVRQAASIRVTANQSTRMAVTLPRGSLSINALPWANVSVDGSPVGTTPLANLSVPVGSHLIVWNHPTLGERRQTVIVKANAPARVGVDMNRRP